MTHQIPGDSRGHGRPEIGSCRKWPQEEAGKGSYLVHTATTRSEWLKQLCCISLARFLLNVTCYLHCLVLARGTMPGLNVEAWDWNSGPHI